VSHPWDRERDRQQRRTPLWASLLLVALLAALGVVLMVGSRWMLAL
jgi:type VI protein secretion system component VasF